MTRLLRDRYVTDDDEHAWDLATGKAVRLDQLPVERLAPPLDALVEVLEHGREGCPRAIAVAGTGVGWPARTILRAAEDARARGFVPIAVGVYGLLRGRLCEEIRERSLLLIAAPDSSPDLAAAALRDAAARTPRPHVLLSLHDASGPGLTSAPSVVREARAAYAPHAVRRAVPQPPDDVRRHLARAEKAADFVRAGRHAAAERLLRDVGSALARRRASAEAARAFIDLGQLLLERGRARCASESFGEAATLAEASGNPAIVVDARLWQAAAKTDEGHLAASEALCRAVLLTTSLEGVDRARVEAALARVLLWQDRIDEAASLPMAAEGCHDSRLAYVGAVAVRVLLGAGRVFEAGQRARETLSAFEHGPDLLARTIAISAHFRVLAAAGDLTLARERLADVRSAAAAARATLRVVRMRLVWADALRRCECTQEAAREDAYLRRVRAAAPPLLRRAIDRHLKAEGSGGVPVRVASASPGVLTSLITLAQREDDDRTAVQRVMEFTAASARCCRVDLSSGEAGPVSIVLSSGAGLPTRLGPRVLEAGIPIGPDAEDAASEWGVPVRLGPRLLAALVARWPADQSPPAHTADLLAVAAAVAAPRVEALLSSSRESSAAAVAIPELVGTSAAMADVRRAVARAAAAPFAVLIDGESGVGKELVARAIHHLGPRRQRRFCDVNCAALPDELIESELFGHARGAFTGAVAERAGLVEDADGGTLFLDEVADLSPRAQAKLLRVIQQQEVRRVGESFSRPVDVRFVSAANRDMRGEAAAGRFRQDLLYRLEVIRIRIPPLRERPEDIATLAAHFWRDAAARVGTDARLTPGVFTALARYHWPGNVRELQNVLAALAVAAPARGLVRPTLLPAAITGAAAVTSGRLADARAQFERRFVEVALARAGGRKARAAREMGLSRQGLLKLLARLGMNR
jgi:DNA-binding NtrC family response regulator